MERGKVYRLHTGFTSSDLQRHHGWLWLCVILETRRSYPVFKSIASGAELELPSRYFIHPTED